jgi:hypothetical protein
MWENLYIEGNIKGLLVILIFFHVLNFNILIKTFNFYFLLKYEYKNKYKF